MYLFRTTNNKSNNPILKYIFLAHLHIFHKCTDRYEKQRSSLEEHEDIIPPAFLDPKKKFYRLVSPRDSTRIPNTCTPRLFTREDLSIASFDGQ